MDLTNRTIVISGASRGLGKALALRLSRRGANLILVARSAGALEEVRERARKLSGKDPTAVPCDITDEAAVDRMAETIAEKGLRPDALVNNAGVGIHKTFAGMSASELRLQYETNCLGSFLCTKALLPSLKKSDSAYVLNVGSLAGEAPTAENYLYASTKKWMAQFSDGLRRELRKSGVRVGLVLPGLMATSFMADYGPEGGVPASLVMDPDRVAGEMVAMIEKRRRIRYLHRWMLLPMIMRRAFAPLA